MKTKILIVVGLLAVAAGIVIVIHANRAHSSNNMPPVAASPTPSLKATIPAKNSAPENIAANNQFPAKVTQPTQAPQPDVGANTTQENQPLVINGYVVQDPMARAALSYVGADPGANAYWADAISDPTLPSEERKDLIEDLNEDGLSNPHDPGPQDMPLIAARIQLIESLAPYAMDQVDANAFAEAEKDLIGMMNGQPPQ